MIFSVFLKAVGPNHLPEVQLFSLKGGGVVMEELAFSLDVSPDQPVNFVGLVHLRGSTASICRVKGSHERFIIRASLREDTKSFAVLEGKVTHTAQLPIVTVETNNLLEHAPWSLEKTKQMVETCSGFGCMGVGFQKAGLTTIAYNDCNPHFARWVSQKGPTVTGHIGDNETIRQLFAITGGSIGLGGGVACQPYSSGGDRKGGDDERSASLPGMLRAALLLNCPWVTIECVGEAQRVPFVIDCVGTFLRTSGFTKAECTLQLQSIWPSRRTRWWCILADPCLNIRSIPDMPKLAIEPVAADLIPGFKDWEKTMEVELELDLYELRCFSELGGLEAYCINPERPFPTALHGWGSQVKGCQCGCRSSGFQPARLATKGLYAAIVPLQGVVQAPTSTYPRMRHLHPEEVALANALPPKFLEEQNPRNMRFELAGVGQTASPAQSVWIGSTVISKLTEAFGTQGPSHNTAMLSLLDELFEVRDATFRTTSIRSQTFEKAVRQLFKAPTDRPNALPLPISPLQQECNNQTTVTDLVAAPLKTPEIASPFLSTTTVSDLDKCQSFVAPTGGLQGFMNPNHVPQAKPEASFRESTGLVTGPWSAPQSEINMHPCKRARTQHHEPKEAIVPSDSHSLHTSHRDLASLDTFPVLVVCWEETPFITKVDRNTTVGQLTVAVASLGSMTQPIRPQNIVGQPKLLSDCLVPHEVVILRFAPQVGKLSCPWNEKPDFDPDRIQERLDLLWCQQARVALDEMEFYVDRLPESLAVAFCPPQHFGRDPKLAEDFCEWIQEQVPRPETTDSWTYACTAVLFAGHWSPISVQFCPDCIYLCVDNVFAPTVQEWCDQVLGSGFVQVSSLTIPKVFDADCGFQTLGWLKHVGAGIEHAPVSSLEAVQWREKFAAYITDSDASIVAASWLWGSGEAEQSIVTRLQAILAQKGVFPDRVPSRAQEILAKVGESRVRDALNSSKTWSDLKHLTNQVQLRMIMGDELDYQIKQRQIGGFSGRKQKASHSSSQVTSSSPVVPQVLAADIVLPTGIFKEVPATPLSQLHLREVGPAASGIVLVDSTDAIALLKHPRPISAKGLAVVIIGPDDASLQGQGELIRFPATFVRTQEPIILTGRLIQLGNIWVQRNNPEKLLQVDQVSTSTIRLLTYRDEFPDEWDSLSSSPAKSVLSQFAFLDASSNEEILDVWDRQWMTSNWSRAKPKAAEVFAMQIRVQSQLVDQFLSNNGRQGIYCEPRSIDGKMPNNDFKVVWLPGASKSEAILSLGNAPVKCTLVRHGNRFGLRAPSDEASDVHKKYRGDTPFLKGDERQLYLVGPLPEGTTKAALLKVFQEWQWDARPLHPKGRTADQAGLSWVIQAIHSPSHWVFQCAHGDVLISVHPRQIITKQTASAPGNILASPHTMDVLTKDEGDKVDPLQLNDPWAKKKMLSVKPPGDHVTLNPTQLTALEAKLQSHIDAKVVTPPADVAMEPSRMTDLEQKFEALAKQQGALEQRLDQAHQINAAQHQQLSQTVQSLAGRVETQGHQMQRQMESTLTSHLEKIEAMLSKRPKHAE